MASIEKIFDKFDKNGDGKISSGELVDVLRALGSETSVEEVEVVMREIDKDGDGFIDIREFTEFYYSGGGGDEESRDKELKEAFDLYDLDKNGLISTKELHAVMNRLGMTCTVSDCGRMISQVDKDGDGSVNFEEFKKMMSK
ncbi:putative calcium-binding protein CML23 [Tripterygium wilfordii]|uniref:Putative calcium-binding protein CML23 n=1 Tax=Tripterygium wilfordii TaxID=458696 RepID=A0A7J7DMM3_TRIWF|nr:calcium-binding protein CML24-like [Tripterygium wilfordii]KAF5747464.1 putative calcium-binding protein CML23 [Tripterygium wilfordii]